MKRQITLLILILFINSFFYGCEDWFKEDEKENYIPVGIMVKGKLTLKNSDGDVINFPEPFEYRAIEIDLGKAGMMGNKFLAHIDYGGNFSTKELMSFKIYKEQPIKAVAYAKSVPDTYTQIYGVAELTWAELWYQVDGFDDYYTWCAELYPVLQLKE